MSQHVPTPIEDYAVLGDLGTAALVSRRGSVDWLCLPRFDSRACFAALLGTPDHGRWLITPADPDAVTTRSYVGNSFVLETTHETATGRVRVTDLMPLGDGRSDLLRRIEGLEGTVRMLHEWTVRFDYGRTRPWVARHTDERIDRTDEVITAIAGPDMLVLRGARLPHAQKGHHVDEFDVTAARPSPSRRRGSAATTPSRHRSGSGPASARRSRGARSTPPTATTWARTPQP